MSCSIGLKNLSIKSENRVLFNNINLNLKHKEKIAIIGENGIGKTTLLRAIVGLKESLGEIEIFHNLLQNKRDFIEARRKVGFLFQDPDDQFITPSVLEEVAFNLINQNIPQDKAILKTKAFLKQFGILHLQNRIPTHLSGGEKKLVALLSILIDEPEILLLDEPSNYLDKNSISKIQDILITIDKSMIIITHDLNFVKPIVSNIYELKRDGLILKKP